MKFYLSYAVALAFSAGVAVPVQAAVVLDQQNFGTTLFGGFTASADPSFRRAQTFTVGVDGTVSRIDIQFDGSPTFDGFNILSTVGGVPSNSVLATALFEEDLLNGFARFSVSLPVLAGDVFGLEPISGFANWVGNNFNSYVDGSSYIIKTGDGITSFTAQSFDFGFRTYVTTPDQGGNVPEPSAVLLLGAGLAGMSSLLRRRNND